MSSATLSNRNRHRGGIYNLFFVTYSLHLIYEVEEVVDIYASRYFKVWRKTYKVWEKPFSYLSNTSYFLHIYFCPRFCISNINTNHPKLIRFQLLNIFPRTIYRILNPNKHKSVLHLFYQLRFYTPTPAFKVHLQLNNSHVLADAELKVISYKNEYCLKLSQVQIQNADSILEQYQHIPYYIKEVGYRLYDDIFKVPFTSQTKVSSILENYPYSRTILYNYFQRVIGSSPSTVLKNRRLLKFAYHLLQSEESVTDSYDRFGFYSTSHLHRNFRNTFGTSPIEFRKRYKRT